MKSKKVFLLGKYIKRYGMKIERVNGTEIGHLEYDKVWNKYYFKIDNSTVPLDWQDLRELSKLVREMI